MAKRSSFGSLVRKKLSDITNTQAQAPSQDEKQPEISQPDKEYIDKLLKVQSFLALLLIICILVVCDVVGCLVRGFCCEFSEPGKNDFGETCRREKVSFDCSVYYVAVFSLLCYDCYFCWFCLFNKIESLNFEVTKFMTLS